MVYFPTYFVEFYGFYVGNTYTIQDQCDGWDRFNFDPKKFYKPRFVHFISTVIVVNMILLGIEVDLAAAIGQARMRMMMMMMMIMVVMMISFWSVFSNGFDRNSFRLIDLFWDEGVVFYTCVCLRSFFALFHGKSPLNHHLGNIFFSQPPQADLSIWVFPKTGEPQNGWFIWWKTLLKWMIWGYHYFRKHPYGNSCSNLVACWNQHDFESLERGHGVGAWSFSGSKKHHQGALERLLWKSIARQRLIVPIGSMFEVWCIYLHLPLKLAKCR